MTELERLQNVLELYGANTLVWPQDERLQLLALVEQSPQATQLFDEAKALDQLLDLPAHDKSGVALSGESRDQSNLQQRILADFNAIQKERNGDRQKTGSVIDFERVRDGKSNRSYAPGGMSNGWMTASALAACFAFGLYLGGIGVGDWRLDPTSSIASFSGSSPSTGEEQLADIGDFIATSGLEEDLL